MLHKNIPYRRRAFRRSKRRLKFLSEKLGYFPSGATKVEKDGKCYYRRFYRGKASPYLKRQSAKRNRRYGRRIYEEDGTISKRSFYRKIFDFWWELY